MNEIDDRLLDYILVTLKEVVEAVSDLYLKHGISDEQINSLKEHIKKLEEELALLKQSELDRKVDKGTSEAFKSFAKVWLAPIFTAVVSAALVALYMGA